ncbi:MAG: hypothetical protein HAW63_03180 [Bdellovibrionaceae bacterium]|nr:hypothetical protein [Pseudobdellovibrionaceae bacterium]
MIKIDLQQGVVQEKGDFREEGTETSELIKAVGFGALKVFFFVIFFLGVYTYEQRELDALNVILAEKENMERVMQQKIIKKKLLVKKLKKTKSDYIDVEKKVYMLKDIAKLRLMFIKAMATLNGFREENLWFRSVDYNQGLLTIHGYTLSKKIFDQFLQNIRVREKSFAGLLVKETKSEKQKGISVRSFYLEINLLN